MTLRPRRDLLDTTSGEPATEGGALPFVWLEGHEHGFYLGVDTDAWVRALYWMPEESHHGFWCFDPEKMAASLELSQDFVFQTFLLALKMWRDQGSVASAHAVLSSWDSHLMNRLLLTTEDTDV